jgi:hypothetical protein
MKLKEKFDMMDITKRAIVTDRKEVIKHILHMITTEFGLNVIFAYLNPNFGETTDYIIIAKKPNTDTMVLFSAIAYGGCSTTQFDAFASKGQMDVFRDNLINNATQYPVKLFDSMLKDKGLSTNPKSDNYWLDNKPDNSHKIIEALEELFPDLSNRKRIASSNTGRRV